MPELIIFDCDGVLIDSEVIGCREEARALNEAGFNVTAEEVMTRFTGMAARDMKVLLESEHGKKMPDDIMATARKRTLEVFKNELEAIEGVTEVLDELERTKVPVCIASGSDPERLDVTLKATGLSGYFTDRVFSAELVEKGKPAPDIFFYASRRMQATPVRTLVLEDSVNGIKAAKAAGMVAFGFCGAGHCMPDHADKLKAAGADDTFKNMGELFDLIARHSL